MRLRWVAPLVIALAAARQPAFAQDAPLPAGVKAVWDLSKAYRETTPTRERICINGLWRWQPMGTVPPSGTVPMENWGFFKVPGAWPGITDYMQKDSQTLYPHPSWRRTDLGSIAAAWYQREILIPKEWSGRRVSLYAEYINSSAQVFLDGRDAGTLLFPAGEMDLTAAAKPGAKQTLSILVKAMPLKAVMLSYSDTNSAKEVKGSVQRRGLCGDVWLIGAPKEARIAAVRVETSVRKWEITLRASLDSLAPDRKYRLKASIADGVRTVKEFTSAPFAAADLVDGQRAFTSPWKPEKLWDIHTPGNQYTAHVSLLDAADKIVDAFTPERFGFREFWIDGKDFYLNGTRIFLSSVPLDNPLVGAAWSTHDAAAESLKRLKSFGINYVYTHNYSCQPGTHLTFAETLRAADDVGMLVGVTQPHFSDYDWKSPDADRKNNYARHAAFYAGVAGNHPSVVFYPTSHNATGYGDDMNPDMIDGIKDPRDTPWAQNGARTALRAQAIIERIDSTRIVYHHSSGNLGSMHTVNFYANWAPVQEMDDWIEHWATAGRKPFFTCEYSVPFTWDWAMYRGWYQGKREWGSAAVPWEFCFAEWNAQFVGDAAYRISDWEKDNLRWEAQRFRSGKGWRRWDYPHEIGAPFDERYPILGLYLSDNWRAFRTWGMSANSPWEAGHYWKLRPGVGRKREELKVDWDSLQRPGLSPDYIDDRYQRMDLAFERTDWISTPASDALYRNNMPLLAYIAGKPAAFTGKGHNFVAGETVEKQVVVINNSRETVACDCSWSLSIPAAARGAKKVTVATGNIERVPLTFALPADLAPGTYPISMTAKFGTGETQTDSFAIHVIPSAAPVKAAAKVAIFDPKGETVKLLHSLGVRMDEVQATDGLAAYDVLVIGKGAITPSGAAPDVSRVKDGLKVIMFEQTGETLEKRLGFRVEEYGLRWVFRRVSDSPALAGLKDEHLRNWRGEATILPPRLAYPEHNDYGGVVRWAGIPVTRVWRCGNRGNVASVLIEKPARGNFLPIVDGGFALQYSPLMEYREGKGMVLFCQMDVTGRTERDPAAETLARNIVDYVIAWKPVPERKAVYVGDPAGKAWLESAGIALEPLKGGAVNVVLIAGPGTKDVKTAGPVLAIGLDEKEAAAILPNNAAVRMKRAEHIAAFFDPFPSASLLAGVAPADVHSREPRQAPLVTGSADKNVCPTGDGVLAADEKAGIVFSQLAPWQFDTKPWNVKRTFRGVSRLTSRLLGNLGVSGSTPLLDRIHKPASKDEKRFLDGLYLDQPEEWDDPYRFFRW